MALASSTYCRFTSARLAPAPVRIKVGGDAPPAVRIKVTVPAEGGDWGGGNPVALASSTYCRFTSARLAPAPVRIKAGGNPVKKSIAFRFTLVLQPVIAWLVPDNPGERAASQTGAAGHLVVDV